MTRSRNSNDNETHNVTDKSAEDSNTDYDWMRTRIMKIKTNTQNNTHKDDGNDNYSQVRWY